MRWRVGLRGLAASATKAADNAINEDRIRLAVTGLSRAGKTVFITSLVQNLLALGGGRNTLPRISQRLAGAAGNRLRDIRVMPAGVSAVPAFEYDNYLARLADGNGPTWPDRTTDIAQISLALDVIRRSPIGQPLGSRRVRLDILDYPGEWLLDLPMLAQSYADWSRETLVLTRTAPRRQVSAPFLEFLSGLSPKDRGDEVVARRGHELYRVALSAARTQHHLRYLQPARFVCPGPRGDVPLMWFFPLEVPPGAERIPGTLGALLEERFEAYKREVRSTFAAAHFAAFDRQIMLVDVLGALVGGRGAFEDTARAIKEITAMLRYGASRPGLARNIAAYALRGARYVIPDHRAERLAGSRIDRVAVVATKADHLPVLRRDHLRNLLRAIVEPADARQSGHGAHVTYHTAASLLATEDSVVDVGGRTFEAVNGIVLGEDKVRPYYVGDVPSSLPPDSFWDGRNLELPRFRPPPIDPSGETGLPHLGLDRVLDDVIGDLL